MNPLCPNCAQPMTQIKEVSRPDDHHTFECKGCKVIYMTEDHTPMTGKVEQPDA